MTRKVKIQRHRLVRSCGSPNSCTELGLRKIAVGTAHFTAAVHSIRGRITDAQRKTEITCWHAALFSGLRLVQFLAPTIGKWIAITVELGVCTKKFRMFRIGHLIVRVLRDVSLFQLIKNIRGPSGPLPHQTSIRISKICAVIIHHGCRHLAEIIRASDSPRGFAHLLHCG